MQKNQAKTQFPEKERRELENSILNNSKNKSKNLKSFCRENSFRSANKQQNNNCNSSKFSILHRPSKKF